MGNKCYGSYTERQKKLQKGENTVWSRKVIFWKSQKLLTERALSELYGGGLFIKFNSYSFNFNGGLCKHRAGYCLLRTPGPRGKQFLRFLKADVLRFHQIYLLFDWIKLLYFYMCLLRINFPNLCPNMNHFDAVDFSECHSEEVISFFWRSVYDLQQVLKYENDHGIIWKRISILPSKINYHKACMWMVSPDC